MVSGERSKGLRVHPYYHRANFGDAGIDLDLEVGRGRVSRSDVEVIDVGTESDEHRDRPGSAWIRWSDGSMKWEERYRSDEWERNAGIAGTGPMTEMASRFIDIVEPANFTSVGCGPAAVELRLGRAVPGDRVLWVRPFADHHRRKPARRGCALP